MKNFYILSILFISNTLFSNPFLQNQDRQLESTNIYLDILRPWHETIELYSTYTPYFISPEIKVQDYNSSLTNKELRSTISFFNRHTSELQRAVENEYLSNPWILLLIATGNNPSKLPRTMSLLENSITDLNNVLIPILSKNERKQPFTYFNNYPLNIKYEIPSFPSIQAAQNKLVLLILEDLYPEIDPTTYIALNRRLLIYGINFPQDINAGSIFAEKFYQILSHNEKFTEKLSESKNEW